MFPRDITIILIFFPPFFLPFFLPFFPFIFLSFLSVSHPSSGENQEFKWSLTHRSFVYSDKIFSRVTFSKLRSVIAESTEESITRVLPPEAG